MVTTVADSLFSRLIEAFPADKAYGSSDFSRDPMPPPLREYLTQRMALRLEDSIRPVDDWIDSDHTEVREATDRYRGVVARHLKIPASAWRIELGLACRNVASYLIRPAPALADLVFAGERENATLEEISKQFRLVPSYSYFEDVIGAYFKQKDLEQISRERFAGLTRRIDQQMVRDFGADEWMKLLQPLLDLVRQIPEFSGGLPVNVMKTFLQEKGAGHLISRLESRFESKGIRFIRRADLPDFFERAEEKVPGGAAEDAATSEEPKAGRDASHRGSHVPLWKQFESGVRPSPEADPAATTAPAGNADPAIATETQPLWKQFRGSERPSTGRQAPGREERRDGSTPLKGRPEPSSPAPRPTPQPSADSSSTNGLGALERSVLGERGQRNRDLFLKHLFSGSENAYEATLRKLNVAENWSEASQIIAREVFLKHQVNIYSDPAVAFTDAAEARFRS